MTGLRTLTIANLRSFVRDRAALFWTLAFPLVFIILFGTIFSSSGRDVDYDVGFVDQDVTAASRELRAVFIQVPAFTITDDSLDAGLASMRKGDLRAVVVVPKGYADAVGMVGIADTSGPGASAGGPSRIGVSLTLYTDPSQQTSANVISGIVGAVVARVNQGNRPPVIAVQLQAIQAQNISIAAYFVPSILAMALMQLGLFGAIPLVQQREKLILKRLNATPLRRRTLIASNVLMRLLIALLQTLLIVGVGASLFSVTILGSPFLVAGLVILGAMMFISLGYVVASFAPTEESANMITSILQFPLMFLSGIFFPLEQMPDWLRTIAAALPLTYLGDALRQVMVGGTPFAPIALSVAILLGWLAVCFGVSSRYFRWQ